MAVATVDLAFSAFFERCGGAKPGFPAKGASLTRLCLRVEGLVITDGGIRIVGVPGAIKVRWHRHLPANSAAGSADGSASRSRHSSP
jgi:hypothetical protein